MTPFQQAQQVYQTEHCARDFWTDLHLHFTHGYVFSTPTAFIMGRPVDKTATYELITDPTVCFPNPNAWLVYLAAGNLREFLRFEPYCLRWIGWERENNLRWYLRGRFLSRFSHQRSIRRKKRKGRTIGRTLRSRMRHLLKRGKSRMSSLIGCSPQFLRQYIEENFKPGMTWQNYGSMWHIDHIRPCASFDLSRKSEQRACFHYTNLQPLWAHENTAKGKTDSKWFLKRSRWDSKQESKTSESTPFPPGGPHPKRFA